MEPGFFCAFGGFDGLALPRQIRPGRLGPREIKKMSGDKVAPNVAPKAPSAPSAPTAASIKAMASELYGLRMDDAAAARIAADLGRFEAGAASAGPVPIDAAPGGLFRQLLLAHDPVGARRA
jgi:hypothetical protein